MFFYDVIASVIKWVSYVSHYMKRSKQTAVLLQDRNNTNACQRTPAVATTDKRKQRSTDFLLAKANIVALSYGCIYLK